MYLLVSGDPSVRQKLHGFSKSRMEVRRLNPSHAQDSGLLAQTDGMIFRFMIIDGLVDQASPIDFRELGKPSGKIGESWAGAPINYKGKIRRALI
jgi:hypothetical protein